MQNIAILILAAGSSSRMKTPKQLLPIKTTTLLGNTIEHSVASKAVKVYCVLGSNFEKIKDSIKAYDIEIILNSEYTNGLSTSIVNGIKHIQPKTFDAVLVLLADQPKVDTNYINTLINDFNKNPETIIASNYSGSYGVPAIFPKHVFEQLLLLKGDKGAKDFLNSENTRVVPLIHSDLIDIDTQEDYNNYLKSL